MVLSLLREPAFAQKCMPSGFDAPLPGHTALAQSTLRSPAPPLRDIAGLPTAGTKRNPSKSDGPIIPLPPGPRRRREMKAGAVHPVAGLSSSPQTPEAEIREEY